jgi:hypothetical protein
MIGMVICGAVRDDEGGPELAKDFDELKARRLRITQCPIAETAEEKFRAEQLCRLPHLAASNGDKIANRFIWLTFVALAHDANADFRAVFFRACQGAGAERFCVIRMRDDGEDAVGFEIDGHASMLARIACLTSGNLLAVFLQVSEQIHQFFWFEPFEEPFGHQRELRFAHVADLVSGDDMFLVGAIQNRYGCR